MATVHDWIEGARPRTLPSAVAPVLIGTGFAVQLDAFHLGRALLALVVALALQVGVNYANDYSDGIKGTDARRVGPVRLVGQQLASPAAVKRAAFASFAVAMVAGLVLVASIGQWWLLIVGALSVVAAWLYTGGPRPYGYLGLGELFVFVFFGPVPTLGTLYVQALTVTAASVLASVAVGLLICAILVVNNLRDIPTDRASGKRTLAVRLGDPGTRRLYLAFVVVAALCTAGVAALMQWWMLATLVVFVLAIPPLRVLRSGAVGRDLVAPLKSTGTLVLAYGVVLGVGVALA